MGESLLARTDRGILRLTLNRPERRNALSRNLLEDLESLIDGLEFQASVRAVVIAAEGPVFCSGHDLSEMLGRDEEDYRSLFATCTRVLLKFRRLPQPVIARVQGPATAAGCQLVAACDLAIAAESATFATPGVKIGLFCTTPMVPLVRTIAPRAAMEMLLTGEPISAQRAMELGLINRVVSVEQLDEAVQSLTDRLNSTSSHVISTGKRAFYELAGLDEATAYELAIPIMTANAMAADAREGISAFLQKRPPQWTGR